MADDMDVDSAVFAKPRPREPKSSTALAKIRVQSRRREYLRKNTAYFDSLEHELADPVLYGRLIKGFQSSGERADESKVKGYGRTLEADLIRGETKLSNLENADVEPSHNGPQAPESNAAIGGDDMVEPWDAAATSKEQGQDLWRRFVEERFIRGGDEDFDYGAVDENEDYDGEARREAEDAWFEDEEPGRADVDCSVEGRRGETGIQDF